MSEPVRVAIVSRDDEFGQSLARAVGGEQDLTLVGCYSSAAEAVDSLATNHVDVLVVDCDVDGSICRRLLAWAERNSSKCQLLVITNGLDRKNVAQLIRQGVAGLFLRQHPAVDFLEAIRTLSKGGKLLDQPFLRVVISGLCGGAQRAVPLTAREESTLRYIVQGYSNRGIAQVLEISETAVKATVQRLFEKTGARGRNRLIRYALSIHREWL